MDNIIEKKLVELEKTAQNFWNIPRETAVILNTMIKIAGYKNILEIGTSNGYSAIWLAEALKKTAGNLTTIEFYEKRIVLAEQNLNDCNLFEYVTIKQGKALEIIKTLNDSYDMIFIDANKSEYIKYFENLHNKLKKGGLFVADNTTSHENEMQDFLEVILNHDEYQISSLPFGGGTIMALKQ